MAAIQDIQKWVEDYRRLYITVVEPFIKSESYSAYTKASQFTLGSVGVMNKGWKGRVNTFARAKWNIDRLKDEDLDSASLIISKDFFNQVAADVRLSLDFNRTKLYLETAVNFMDIAKGWKDALEKHGVTYMILAAHHLGEMIAIGSLTMMHTVLYPYHLFVHLAWNSQHTHKLTDPRDIISAYYEFYSDPSWLTLNQYVGRLVRDSKIPDLLSDLCRTGLSNKTIDKIADKNEYRKVVDKVSEVSGATQFLRILGNNLTGLYIRSYVHE